MIMGNRIAARLEALGKSQSWLGRQLGLHQSTINGMIRGGQRSTTYLLPLAKALRTSPEYLTGGNDDPDENAPAPPPATPYQAVTLQVLLPGEAALARMFEGLLRVMDRSAPLDEQALILAQRLPIGLSQLRDLMPTTPTPASTRTRRSRSTRVPEPQP